MIVSSRYDGTMAEPPPYPNFDLINEAKAQIAEAELRLKRQKLSSALDYLDEVLPHMGGYDKFRDLNAARGYVEAALMAVGGETKRAQASEVVLAS